MKPLIFAIALSFGADAASTHVGRATERTREVLLPTQNPYVIDAIVAGEAIAVSLALNRLHKDHPKLATRLGWGIVGYRSTLAVHNLYALR